jgi:arylsulfatase A-like enzyme
MSGEVSSGFFFRIAAGRVTRNPDTKPMKTRKPLVAIALAAATTLAATASPKPNFILLLTDDQGWADRSSPADPAYPDSCRAFFHTPHLDRLSKESMNFTSGYSPGHVCTPTRRSIQFGMTPARIRGTEFKSDFDPAGHLTLPQMIKRADASYVCAHFGKWGEYMIGDSEFGDPRGLPENFGYDVSDGYTGNVHGTCDAKTKFTLFAHEDPKRILSMTDEAIGFLKERSADGKPFYMQMSYYAIHRTPEARQATIDKYAGKGDPRGGETTLNLPPMLDELDAGVGRLLDAVRDLGLEGTTFVFYGSDNGGAGPVQKTLPKGQVGLPPDLPARNAPLNEGKGTIFEGGVRVPFMVRGPGVPENRFCRTPVVLYDIYATIHDLLGARDPLPETIDGTSIKELIFRGDEGGLRRPGPGLIFHLPNRVFPHSAMRDGDYKVMVHWKDKEWGIRETKLYRLTDDIGERKDLSAEMPEKARGMTEALVGYLKASGAELPFAGKQGTGE